MINTLLVLLFNLLYLEVLDYWVIHMKRIRITVIRKVCHKDHACDMEEGQVFIANGWQRPDGLCESAWETMSPFVMALAHGAKNFYDGWMKNPKSAMISCNDGFRPVSFLIETLEEEAKQS